MEKQNFNITIDAPREKVWDVLWGDTTYPEWTSAFAEGSRVETDWEEGSKALFAGPDNGGMVSTIAENRPNEFLSIRHVGIVNDGVGNFDSETANGWAGALENYTLKSAGGKTELFVDMDITEEYREYFQNAWPKALRKVKELAERVN